MASYYLKLYDVIEGKTQDASAVKSEDIVVLQALWRNLFSSLCSIGYHLLSYKKYHFKVVKKNNIKECLITDACDIPNVCEI